MRAGRARLQHDILQAIPPGQSSGDVVWLHRQLMDAVHVGLTRVEGWSTVLAPPRRSDLRARTLPLGQR